jgi:myosin heavy subunit
VQNPSLATNLDVADIFQILLVHQFYRTMSGNSQEWWIPDDAEVWTLATQSGAKLPNGCVNFQVHKDKSMVAYPAEKCIMVVGTTSAPEDLVFLHDVNQATILNCIRARFKEKKIYTSVGAVLMTVNPFERIPGIYGKDIILRYADPESKNTVAHVYEIPSRAYSNMCRTGENQSILISGESGAGTNRHFTLTYFALQTTVEAD